MLRSASFCAPFALRPQISEILGAPLRAARCATQRVHDALEAGPCAGTLTQYAQATVAGAAVVAAAGLAASQTFVPALAHLSRNSAKAHHVLYEVPYVGQLLAQTLASGGVLGAVATSGVWLGVIYTLMLSESGSDAFGYWTMAHIAIGVAIAPFLLPGVAATAGAPILGATACAALTASYTVSGRLLLGKSTWQGTITGVLAALALGPMGAQVATGVAAGQVISTALTWGATGAILIGACLLNYGWRTLTTDQTAELSATAVDLRDALELDIPGAVNPGLSNTPSVLLKRVKAGLFNLRHGVKLDQDVYLLYGPPGAGKTVTAKAIAKAYGALCFSPRLSDIYDGRGDPATNAVRYVRQARIKASITGCPVIFLIDEGERLFENRAGLQHSGAIDRATHALVCAFNEEFDGVQQHKKSNVIFIISTNHPENMDPSILSRCFVRASFEAPSAEDIAGMFDTQLAQRQNDRAIAYVGALKFAPRAVAHWSKVCKAHQFYGREIKNVVEEAIVGLTAAYVDEADASWGSNIPSLSGRSAWAQKSAVLLEEIVDAKIETMVASKCNAAMPEPLAPSGAEQARPGRCA